MGYNNTALSPGDKWELPTELPTGNMKPCGYVIAVEVNDLAILNSGKGSFYSGHYSWASIGFCLKKATTVVT